MLCSKLAKSCKPTRVRISRQRFIYKSRRMMTYEMSFLLRLRRLPTSSRIWEARLLTKSSHQRTCMDASLVKLTHSWRPMTSQYSSWKMLLPGIGSSYSSRSTKTRSERSLRVSMSRMPSCKGRFKHFSVIQRNLPLSRSSWDLKICTSFLTLAILLTRMLEITFNGQMLKP